MKKKLLLSLLVVITSTTTACFYRHTPPQRSTEWQEGNWEQSSGQNRLPTQVTPKYNHPHQQPQVQINRHRHNRQARAHRRYKHKLQKARRALRRCRNQKQRLTRHSSHMLKQLQQTRNSQRWEQYQRRLELNQRKLWAYHRCVQAQKSYIQGLKRQQWQNRRRNPSQLTVPYNGQQRSHTAPQANRHFPQAPPHQKSEPAPHTHQKSKQVNPFAPPPSQNPIVKARPLPQKPAIKKQPRPTNPPQQEEELQPKQAPQKQLTHADKLQLEQHCAELKSKQIEAKKPYLDTHRSRVVKGKAIHTRIFQRIPGGELTQLSSSLGQYILLGQKEHFFKAHCSDFKYHLWDNKNHKLNTITAPISSFLSSNPDLHPWAKGQKKNFGKETLIHYDPNKQQAGLLLQIQTDSKKYKVLYLQWDLDSNQIINARPVGLANCDSSFRFIGLSPSGKKLFFLEDTSQKTNCSPNAPNTPKQQNFIAIQLDSGKKTILSRLTHQFPIDKIVHNPAMTVFALAEETEKKQEKGSIFIIDQNKWKAYKLKAPHSITGLILNEKGNQLHIYSSALGQLWNYQLKASFPKTIARVQTGGEAIGFSKDQSQLYIAFSQGVEIRSNTGKKRLSYQKISWPLDLKSTPSAEATQIINGTLFVKAGKYLLLQNQVLVKQQTTAKSIPPAKPSVKAPKVKPNPSSPPEEEVDTTAKNFPIEI